MTTAQIKSRSTLFLIDSISGARSLASFEVIVAAIIGRAEPHARPIAVLWGKNTYGTFLSSQSNGRCITIARGAVSAAITTISDVHRSTDFVTRQILALWLARRYYGQTYLHLHLSWAGGNAWLVATSPRVLVSTQDLRSATLGIVLDQRIKMTNLTQTYRQVLQKTAFLFSCEGPWTSFPQNGEWETERVMLERSRLRTVSSKWVIR